MVYTEKDYLAHYGVKGMRRGQRRTPRDMAQISGPAQATYGDNASETELGYSLYKQSPVAGRRKEQWRAHSNVSNARSRDDITRGMAGHGGWRAKDRKRVRYK